MSSESLWNQLFSRSSLWQTISQAACYSFKHISEPNICHADFFQAAIEKKPKTEAAPCKAVLAGNEVSKRPIEVGHNYLMVCMFNILPCNVFRLEVICWSIHVIRNSMILNMSVSLSTMKRYCN